MIIGGGLLANALRKLDEERYLFDANVFQFKLLSVFFVIDYKL
jgi:hypothetical protein